MHTKSSQLQRENSAKLLGDFSEIARIFMFWPLPRQTSVPTKPAWSELEENIELEECFVLYSNFQISFVALTIPFLSKFSVSFPSARAKYIWFLSAAPNFHSARESQNWFGAEESFSFCWQSFRLKYWNFSSAPSDIFCRLFLYRSVKRIRYFFQKTGRVPNTGEFVFKVRAYVQTRTKKVGPTTFFSLSQDFSTCSFFSQDFPNPLFPRFFYFPRFLTCSFFSQDFSNPHFPRFFNFPRFLDLFVFFPRFFKPPFPKIFYFPKTFFPRFLTCSFFSQDFSKKSCWPNFFCPGPNNFTASVLTFLKKNFLKPKFGQWNQLTNLGTERESLRHFVNIAGR